MYQKSILENELRIISSSMPHTRSVAIGIYMGAGSRYESDDNAGISHFIEHLTFKGTARRPSSASISEAIEGVGGILNGGTDKELTIFWCKVARPHFTLALDVLSDMLLNSKLEPQDIEHERQVIAEEINMSMDAPQSRADLMIDEIMWPGQPLGRDVAGTKESLARIDREKILKYLQQQYLANNTVISVAGDISHEEVVENVSCYFSGLKKGSLSHFPAADDTQVEPAIRIEQRKIEQDNLVMGIRGLSARHPDRFAFDLLSVILGEGMSSRLFVEIREKAGLAYDIHSYVNHFDDTGALYICAGVDPDKLPYAVTSIVEQLSKLKEPVPPGELSKVKELTKGRLLLRMEETRSVSGWLGGQELLLNEILTVDQVTEQIDKISREDISRVAHNILVTGKINVGVVGPVKHNDLADLLVIK